MVQKMSIQTKFLAVALSLGAALPANSQGSVPTPPKSISNDRDNIGREVFCAFNLSFAEAMAGTMVVKKDRFPIDVRKSALEFFIKSAHDKGRLEELMNTTSGMVAGAASSLEKKLKANPTEALKVTEQLLGYADGCILEYKRSLGR